MRGWRLWVRPRGQRARDGFVPVRTECSKVNCRRSVSGRGNKKPRRPSGAKGILEQDAPAAAYLIRPPASAMVVKPATILAAYIPSAPLRSACRERRLGRSAARPCGGEAKGSGAALFASRYSACPYIRVIGQKAADGLLFDIGSVGFRASFHRRIGPRRYRL